MSRSDDPTHWQREHERARLREKELKDLEVERNRGPRPLEGLSSGGHTTWTGQQDDRAAAEVHGHDREDAEAASEEQVRRLDASGDADADVHEGEAAPASREDGPPRH
ncbi:hypothetical protein FGE12_14145 [Aggregicoccus sp. 17bor-14]|uniref:hypothetical protein n=1 Tax=Myxococcaceae TaxID=31 RepID=UPI00129CC944|nr:MULTISPECIES: hypothetical protein [Myxococcaceae]MRI89293.1 hypothetical protein [Aggregicoccus sp. 17bor-14]